MRINNNLMAMNTHRQLGIGNSAAAKSMEKLSSGLRINRAGDDAAGLSISEKMRGQIRGLNQASRNAQDGISLIQTAEGALQETHAILQRMRELAVQSANDTNQDVDREAIQKEIDQLATEITRISTDTEFNNEKVLNGSYQDKTLQIGANKDQNITLSIANMSAFELGVAGTPGAVSAVASDGSSITLAGVATDPGLAAGTYTVVDVSSHAVYGGTYSYALQDANGNIVALGVDGDDNDGIDEINAWVDVNDTNVELIGHTANASLDVGSKFTVEGNGINVSSQGDANNAIEIINNAIKRVSQERSMLGAIQNRLEHTIRNLDTSAENLQAAESRIRDVDMAKEMMEFTKNNILQQAAQAMLAQANQAPQGILQLLR
ncbi:MAG TPA: flagellin [Clostridiales bacterium]|nr:flagellin [Clostridiales bacterium]